MARTGTRSRALLGLAQDSLGGDLRHGLREMVKDVKERTVRLRANNNIGSGIRHQLDHGPNQLESVGVGSRGGGDGHTATSCESDAVRGPRRRPPINNWSRLGQHSRIKLVVPCGKDNDTIEPTSHSTRSDTGQDFKTPKAGRPRNST